jgi:hypothetical protein
MMAIIGLAIAAIGIRTAIEEFTSGKDAIGFSEAELSFLQQTLISRIDEIEQFALTCWRYGLAGTSITLVVFMIWSYFAHRNIALMGARGVRHKSALSFFYWFIPVLNMFLPHFALKETWYGSDPSGLTMRRKSKSDSPRLIGAHWLAFLLGFSWYPTVIVLVFALSFSGMDVIGWFEDHMNSSDAKEVYKWAVISSTATVFMNIAGMVLVNDVSQMQYDRHRIFEARNN